MTTTSERKIHQGRNVKRFREMQGMKQEAFAMELGDDWTQKKVSLLEAKEEIEPQLLELVASVLKVPKEAIENFDDEAAINIISNTFSSNDHSTLNAINHSCTFNAVDKIVELYERMLRDRDVMIERLEKLLSEKK